MEEAVLLAELVAADQFKSYEELKKRLGYVLGNAAPRQDAEVEDEVEIMRERAEQVVTAATSSSSAPVTASADADEEDTLSYFARLAEE